EERATLIRGYYQEFLNRQPGQAEVDIWLRAFNAGLTAEAVESQIAGSLEAYSNQGLVPVQWLRSMYELLLGRDLDPGSNAFLAFLQGGAPRSAVVGLILSSDEFRSNLIAATYRTYLGRQVTPGELNDWLTWMRGFPAANTPISPTEGFVVG